MPGLDVLRGLAILSVLIYHGFYWSESYRIFPNGYERGFVYLTVFGWLGVNLFFVLSGFLITGILLDARKKAAYFRPFYLRRVVRIIPAYLLCITILFFTSRMNSNELAVYIFYGANLLSFRHLVQYGVLWSLSVEEQFYAIWPTIVRFLPGWTFFFVCVALIPLCPLLRWFSVTHGNILGDVHTSTPLIADHFAGGACLACILREKIRKTLHGAILASTLTIIGISILASGYRYGILHRSTTVGSALQTTPFLFMFCGLLLFSLLPPIAPWMEKRSTLKFFGYISYGLYLYHLFFFRLYDWLASKGRLPAVTGHFDLLVLRFSCSSICAIAFSWISRRYFEEYFLSMRKNLRSQ